MIDIKIYMISCRQRSQVRLDTLHELVAETDYPSTNSTPRVYIDPNESEPDKRITQHQNYLRMLFDSLGDAYDYALFLEDDLHFNRHLWHNLQNWTPLIQGFLLGGSLYNPGICGYENAGRSVHNNSHYFLTDSLSCWGSQAFILSRKAVEFIVSRWNSEQGMQDIKVSRILNLCSHTMIYHLPCLVQHRQVSCTWGNGTIHQSSSFDREFKSETQSPA